MHWDFRRHKDWDFSVASALANTWIPGCLWYALQFGVSESETSIMVTAIKSRVPLALLPLTRQVPGALQIPPKWFWAFLLCSQAHALGGLWCHHHPFPCSCCAKSLVSAWAKMAPFILNASQRHCCCCPVPPEMPQLSLATTKCLIRVQNPYTRWLVPEQRKYLLWTTKGLVSELPGSPHMFSVLPIVENFPFSICISLFPLALGLGGRTNLVKVGDADQMCGKRSRVQALQSVALAPPSLAVSLWSVT